MKNTNTNTMNNSTQTFAMANPNYRQDTADFIKQFNLSIISVNELPNINQPDVTLSGSKQDLQQFSKALETA